MFRARESLVSDIPAGDGKIINLFYNVGTGKSLTFFYSVVFQLQKSPRYNLDKAHTTVFQVQ